MAFFKKQYVPVQKSRTFFRQKSVFDGEKEDSIGNSTDLAGNDIDSPGKKKTVPDFLRPFGLIEASGWMNACQESKGRKAHQQTGGIPPVWK